MGSVLPLFAADQRPLAKEGVLDLRDWDFEKNDAIGLSGEWKFLWLEDSREFTLPVYNASSWDTIGVPMFWNEQTGSGEGYGWYRLKILLPQDKDNSHLGIYVEYLYTSYELYVNGRRIMANGIPGISRESSYPQFLPKLRKLKLSKNTKELTIAIKAANFHRKRGGAWSSPKLGSHEKLKLSLFRKDAIDIDRKSVV